jgi:acyl dehydratase
MTRTRIGAEAHRTRRVTERDVALFTEITGDANPLHYDAELAARSRFGGLVVQGGVTSGLLNALVAEQLPGPGSVFLEVAWRFLAPVRPGDEITARAVVTDVRDDKPVTSLRTTVTDQDGVVVLDGTAVVWRDPVVAAATAQRAGKAGGKTGGSPGEGAVPSVLDDQHPPMPDQPAPAMEDR